MFNVKESIYNIHNKDKMFNIVCTYMYMYVLYIHIYLLTKLILILIFISYIINKSSYIR